jgi:hypothetical protein
VRAVCACASYRSDRFAKAGEKRDSSEEAKKAAEAKAEAEAEAEADGTEQNGAGK